MVCVAGFEPRTTRAAIARRPHQPSASPRGLRSGIRPWGARPRPLRAIALEKNDQVARDNSTSIPRPWRVVLTSDKLLHILRVTCTLDFYCRERMVNLAQIVLAQ